MEEKKPKTRLVINRPKFEELMREKGIKNINHLIGMSLEKRKPLSHATIYKVLSNGNFQKESLERLSEVLEIDLGEFVTFEGGA